MGIDNLAKRLQDSDDATAKVADFFRELEQVEGAYANALENLGQKYHDLVQNNPETLPNFLQIVDQILSFGKTRGQLKGQYEVEMIEPIATFMQTEGRNGVASVKAAESHLSACMAYRDHEFVKLEVVRTSLQKFNVIQNILIDFEAESNRTEGAALEDLDVESRLTKIVQDEMSSVQTGAYSPKTPRRPGLRVSFKEGTDTIGFSDTASQMPHVASEVDDDDDDDDDVDDDDVADAPVRPAEPPVNKPVAKIEATVNAAEGDAASAGAASVKPVAASQPAVSSPFGAKAFGASAAAPVVASPSVASAAAAFTSAAAATTTPAPVKAPVAAPVAAPINAPAAAAPAAAAPAAAAPAAATPAAATPAAAAPVAAAPVAAATSSPKPVTLTGVTPPRSVVAPLNFAKPATPAASVSPVRPPVAARSPIPPPVVTNAAVVRPAGAVPPTFPRTPGAAVPPRIPSSNSIGGVRPPAVGVRPAGLPPTFARPGQLPPPPKPAAAAVAAAASAPIAIKPIADRQFSAAAELEIAIIETIHCQFLNNNLRRCEIAGQVNIVGAVKESPQIDRFHFALKGRDDMDEVLPNRAFVSSVESGGRADGTTFSCNLAGLRSSLATGNQGGAIKYKLTPAKFSSKIPLIVSISWKLEPSLTSVIISYKGVTETPVTLKDLTFEVKVSGGVQHSQTKPDSVWIPETSTCRWSVGDVTIKPGQVEMTKLLGRFTVGIMSTQTPVNVSFTIENSLLSETSVTSLESPANIAITGHSTKVVAGKYFAQ